MQNGPSKIELIVDEIDQYLTEECKPYPLSKSKIIVDREQMEYYLSQLRLKTPDEIKRFQRFLKNKDAILEDAQSKADAMLADANANVEKLINEHEIVQMATAQAQGIIQEAQQRAEQIVKAAQNEAMELKEGSLSYVGESLNNLQILIANTMNTVNSKMGSFVDSMQNYYTIVEENKKEIEALSNASVQPLEEPLYELVAEDEFSYNDSSYE